MSYIQLHNDNVLNEGTDEELLYFSYCNSKTRRALYYFLAIVTLGLSLLFFYWKPNLKVKLEKKQCSPANATSLILKNKYHEVFVEPVIEKIVSYSFPREYAFSATNSSGYGSFQTHHVGNGAPVSEEKYIFRYFIHHHVRYIWNQQKRKFFRLRGYDVGVRNKDLLEEFPGLKDEEVMEKLLIYGENSINIEIKSYLKLFKEEILHPFYIFQIFSFILWFVDNYIIFSSCILIITSISLAFSLYETRKQSKTLHDMVASVNDMQVTVKRNDLVEIPSTHLVPGDIIVIPRNGCIMSCDAVLIAGSCIVNESMLTGESVPVMKTQLPIHDDQELYSPELHKRHTLFCGTEVIQTRYYGQNNVTAVVIRTGFSTAKGELVRSILFPHDLGFQFYRDSMRFVVFLFIISVAGVCYSLYIYIKAQFPISRMIIRVLDIVTVVVPPSLPAAMTVGSVCAQNRLKKKNIFCISPPRINVSGRLELFCFDKTGTLTEEGLDLWQVLPVENQVFIPMVTNPKLMDPKSPLVAAMATCHTLTLIDGVLKGDPLELKMFEAIDWIIEEPGEDHSRFDMLCPTVVYPPSSLSATSDLNIIEEQMTQYQIGIVQQFTFSSSLQRMSVVTRSLQKQNMDVYVKGAPEKIATLCYPYTVPEDFSVKLQSLTMQGYRVIALAWKPLDSKIPWHQVQRLKRDEIESDLSFLGLLVLQNKLKPETTPVISILNNAKIRTIMATGDNMHTAMSVARECGMIDTTARVITVTAHSPKSSTPAHMKLELAENNDTVLQNEVRELSINEDMSTYDVELGPYHICMDGRTFTLICQYFPDLVNKFMIRSTVFARMSPDQKTHLVDVLKKLGYTVGMCGDGANDCGALKTADVGISLSEAEASVAAPFTSRIPDIRCVPIVIKEGRCALVTSFGVFKYMALYSLIQFISVLIMYTYETNLGDQQFLYIDLCLATVMAFVMSYTSSYDALVPELPPGSLVSLPVIFSVLSQILLAGAIQVGSILFLSAQTWYVETCPDTQDVFKTCWEASVVFGVANFQYVITSLVFSKGPPFRQPFYKNRWMIASLITFTTLNLIFLLHPFQWLAEIFQLSTDENPHQIRFRLWLLAFPVMNLVFAIAIEFIANSKTMKIISKKCRRKRDSSHYKALELEMAMDTNWPILNQFIYSNTT